MKMKKIKKKKLKNDYIRKINSGIKGISKDSKDESDTNKFMLESSNNIIF